MADTVKLARAIIEIGATGVQEAEKQVKALESDLTKLGASYKAGKVGLSEYTRENVRLHAEIAQLRAGITAAEAAIKKHGSAQAAAAAMAKQANKEAKNYGQGIMAASFTIQDFMSANGDLAQALYRVQNNIPGLLTMFGMSGGLAGAISIGSLALGMFLPKIIELVKELGIFKDAADAATGAIEQLNTRIQELEAKPIKLAVDLYELDQAKAKLKALEAAKEAFVQMGNTATPEEKASGGAVSEAFGGLGVARGDQVQAKLKADMVKELAGQSKTIANVEKEQAAAQAAVEAAQKRMAHATSQGAAMEASRAIESANARVEAAKKASEKARYEIDKQGGEAEQKIGEMWAEAIKGNVDVQKKLADRLKAAGEHELAAKVLAAPEAAQRELEQRGIENDRHYRAQQRQKNRELTEQGKTTENDYFQQLADERSAEATRFAQQLQPRLSSEVLEMGGGTQEQLEAKVRAALQKAGVAADDIGKMTTEVAAKLRMGVQERIRTKVLGGLTQEQAVRSVRQEDKEAQQSLKRLPKSEVLSTESYLNKLLVAGMSREGNEPKPVKLDDGQIGGVNDRLDKILDATKENKPGVARFAGGDAARENGPMM